MKTIEDLVTEDEKNFHKNANEYQQYLKDITEAFQRGENIKTNINCTQFEYSEGFSIEKLPSPFNKPDIVVFHECYRIQYIKIARELQKLKVPYVILPHGELSKDAQKKKRLKKVVANILIFNSFINHSVGLQMLSDVELKNTKFSKYKFVATNGINIPDLKKQQFRDSKLKFVYVGRLDAYHKGLDIMVEGVASVAEILRAEDVMIDIYGPDILGRREHLNGLIQEHGVGDIIKLHDSIFKDEKECVLLDADAFIQTSRFEGMPMGILEALSYGIPCLVTEGTTLADFVRKNNVGWACDTSTEGIAEAIKNVLSQRNEFLEKSQNARDAVIRDFAWDSISKATVDKYAELTLIK